MAQGYGTRAPVDDSGLGRRELLLGAGGLAVVGAGGLWAFTDVLGGSDTDISYGDTVTGDITADSPEDPVDGRLGESYAFSGSAGDMVSIAMQSQVIDTYLILTDSDGIEVDRNDDGGNGVNSQMQLRLPESGTYTIWATSYGGDETGPFTLSLSQL